ncbi:LacI family DNA-binding transcriptional regulator [Mucilaginibacter sp. X4EP1]|uniref:LacI family DNA-binding transcriptional regulator n=1 Tax=Mucilaginibacter sp. X4EP1 TaxID=2723092 RepID=UPI002167EE1F|nr:LacI family DNA-binding transcriptional regulator [Mucilaginibacter sp. X4EP1]MCS3814630.1 LacI family transcriptional regulator [Mucilaginibacter sp. X4EP1]
MGEVNIKKLAYELNLSAATVSRALRDSHEISAETKMRVLEMAKRLNYEPNPFASSLRHQKSKTIAVIVPEIANNFFSLAINGIEEVARERDYHVLIYQTHESSKIETSFLMRLLSGRVDGILISLASEAVDKENFKEVSKKLPIVFFDRVHDDIEGVKITTDDYDSTYNAVQHLVENGCKRIGYLRALDTLSTGKKRMQGYLDALKDNNFPEEPALVMIEGEKKDQRYSLIKSFIEEQKPDGILSSIEELAMPCYYACKEVGLNIPKDLKLISFSNLTHAELLNPSLTTINQPAFEIGVEAAGILFKIFNKRWYEFNETIVLKSNLIKRESTRGNF